LRLDVFVHGYLESPLFACGDHVGSEVTASNIRYTEEYASWHNIVIKECPWDQTQAVAKKEAPLIIKRLAPKTVDLVFNVKRMPVEQPQLWQQILDLPGDGVLDEEVLARVSVEIALKAWNNPSVYQTAVKNLVKEVLQESLSKEQAGALIDSSWDNEATLAHFCNPDTGESGFSIGTGCQVYIDLDLSKPHVKKCFQNVAAFLKTISQKKR
jgi:hypothetical protein